MRLHHLEHEHVVLLHPAGIGEFAFEIGVAFVDQGAAHMRAGLRREAELGELVDVAAGRVADPHHGFRDVDGRDVDDALPALADEVKTVVAARDQAGESDGENSITMCQPMVMMLVSFLCAELTRTIGPGSRKRRMFQTGKSFLV
jgi:hypothetical protein